MMKKISAMVPTPHNRFQNQKFINKFVKWAMRFKIKKLYKFYMIKNNLVCVI